MTQFPRNTFLLLCMLLYIKNPTAQNKIFRNLSQPHQVAFSGLFLPACRYEAIRDRHIFREMDFLILCVFHSIKSTYISSYLRFIREFYHFYEASYDIFCRLPSGYYNHRLLLIFLSLHSQKMNPYDEHLQQV